MHVNYHLRCARAIHVIKSKALGRLSGVSALGVECDGTPTLVHLHHTLTALVVLLRAQRTAAHDDANAL